MRRDVEILRLCGLIPFACTNTLSLTLSPESPKPISRRSFFRVTAPSKSLRPVNQSPPRLILLLYPRVVAMRLIWGSNYPTAGVSYGEIGPAFVVDASMAEEELRALRSRLLLVSKQMWENSLVASITFDFMVRVYDLGFSECYKVVVFHSERELLSEQIND